MQSTEANNPGKRVVFVAIGLALLGLVVFGVVWAKNRADQVASASETTQEPQGEVQTESEPVVEETGITEGHSHSEGEVAGVEVSQSQQPTATSSLPATGPTDILLATAMLGILAFSVTKFVQSEVLGRRV